MKIIIPKLANLEFIDRFKLEYDFHFCNIDEIDKVVDFIDKHWKKGHILVQSRELLNWQHFNSERNEYNFVVAVDKDSGEIHGILGFISTRNFDKQINNIQVWPAIWKVCDDIGTTGLGLALYNYLQCNLCIETITNLGINPSTENIYKNLGFETGVLKQWYILNNEISNFCLITNDLDQDHKPNHSSSYGYALELCAQNDFLDFSASVALEFPHYKSPRYYIKRFFEHPLYQYSAYSVVVRGFAKAVIFTRICQANGNKAVRIVDYLGEHAAISGCYDCFQQLLRRESAEYVDFINIGFSEKYLIDAGFRDRNDSKIIIPDYYEPFCQKNVDIHYVFKTINNEVSCLIFKGDSDQDRPSSLRRQTL
jgi:hypothetical protein